VPGTIFGIGYLLAFNDPIRLGDATIFPKLTGARGVAGGALAIVLIYILRSVPAALRAGVSALQQIDKSIEEASVSLGADTATTFRKITLPLIRPAFFSGLIYAFSRSMTTISAVIFLTTPETKIMTQQIYNETDASRFGNAFAYVVVLILIVLAVITLLSLIVGVDNGARRRERT
jgi:iron(III) transport system permease protein